MKICALGKRAEQNGSIYAHMSNWDDGTASSSSLFGVFSAGAQRRIARKD